MSKNQVLQILYLKHHVHKTSKIIMDKKKKLNEIHDNLIYTHKINNHTTQYKILQRNKTQTYLVTGQPS